MFSLGAATSSEPELNLAEILAVIDLYICLAISVFKSYLDRMISVIESYLEMDGGPSALTATPFG